MSESPSTRRLDDIGVPSAFHDELRALAADHSRSTSLPPETATHTQIWLFIFAALIALPYFVAINALMSSLSKQDAQRHEMTVYSSIHGEAAILLFLVLVALMAALGYFVRAGLLPMQRKIAWQLVSGSRLSLPWHRLRVRIAGTLAATTSDFVMNVSRATAAMWFVVGLGLSIGLAAFERAFPTVLLRTDGEVFVETPLLSPASALSRRTRDALLVEVSCAKKYKGKPRPTEFTSVYHEDRHFRLPGWSEMTEGDQGVVLWRLDKEVRARGAAFGSTSPCRPLFGHDVLRLSR